jgi:TPR repeat protein
MVRARAAKIAVLAALAMVSAGASAALRERPPIEPAARRDALAAYEQARRHSAQDSVVAASWYRYAAERGYAPAQYRLALLYSRGSGVAKDPRLALAWLRKAAAQRHAEAQYRLAAVYLRGAYGVARDEEAGLRWLRRSARQGYAEAQFALGNLYAAGRGVPHDAMRALRWIALAARNGHREAQRALRRAGLTPLGM